MPRWLRAERTIVVAGHTKFDRPALAISASWHETHFLVTDRAPTGALASALDKAHVEIFAAA
jgi:DeoR/GlpR family transcriptional regulator of sugar metabolism